MTDTKTTTTLHDSPVPVRAKLAAAWTSFMFLYIYVDYLHLYKPGALTDIGCRATPSGHPAAGLRD